MNGGSLRSYESFCRGENMRAASVARSAKWSQQMVVAPVASDQHQPLLAAACSTFFTVDESLCLGCSAFALQGSLACALSPEARPTDILVKRLASTLSTGDAIQDSAFHNDQGASVSLSGG